MAKSKKYKYFYREAKDLGDLIRGTQPFIAHIVLKDKYSLCYVNMVFRGERWNDEIISVMKKLAELSKAENY